MPKESTPRSKSGRIMDYLAKRSNVGRPFRAIKELLDDPPSLTGPIRDKDIERSFDAAGLVSAGSMAGKRPRNSVGTGGRQYKVSGAQSQVQVNQPKPGSSKFVGPVKPKAKRKESGSSSSGAPASKQSSSKYSVSGAQQNYTGSKPKPGSKNFIGPTRATQPGEKGFIGPTRPPRSGDKDFVGPVKPSPEKKGMSTAKKVGIAGAATGAITAGYLGTRDGSSKSGAKTETPQGDVLSLRKDSNAATRRNSGVKGGQGFQAFGKTDQNTPGTLMRRGSPLKAAKDWLRENPEDAKKRPDMDRRLADVLEKGVYGSNAAGTKKTPKKEEGRKTFGARSSGPDIKRPAASKSSTSSAPSAASPGASGSSGGDKKVGAATDKSRLAPKMTNFQRQKARQFEKEGVAGRSMTRAQAKRKASEKGSSVAGLRSLFGLSKTKSAPDKKSRSSEFRKKNLAANQKIGKKQ